MPWAGLRALARGSGGLCPHGADGLFCFRIVGWAELIQVGMTNSDFYLTRGGVSFCFFVFLD